MNKITHVKSAFIIAVYSAVSSLSWANDVSLAASTNINSQTSLSVGANHGASYQNAAVHGQAIGGTEMVTTATTTESSNGDTTEENPENTEPGLSNESAAESAQRVKPASINSAASTATNIAVDASKILSAVNTQKDSLTAQGQTIASQLTDSTSTTVNASAEALASVNNNLQQNVASVSGSVNAAVDQQLNAVLASATENNVQGSVQQAVSNSIDSSINTAINNTVQTTVANNIADTIESTVNSNVTTALNDSLDLGL